MQVSRAAVLTLLGGASLCVTPASTAAQVVRTDPRAATAMEVVAGNVLVGGLTAATRAAIGGKNVWKAFAAGSLGGAVHVAGKHLGVEPGPLNGWLGLAVAGTGTSIVSNGGRGVGLLDEISVPFAATRIRVTPRDRRKVRVAVNAADAAAIAGAFFHRDLAIDWSRSVSSGAGVFQLRRGRLVAGGEAVNGFAPGALVIMERQAMSNLDIGRHEIIHVYQHWFAHDAWGRPIEGFIRRHVPGGRLIPSWLEIGLVPYGLRIAEDHVFGESGLSTIVEAEAYRLMRR